MENVRVEMEKFMIEILDAIEAREAQDKEHKMDEDKQYEVGFNTDELTLNYTSWTQLVENRKNHLGPDVRKWLSRWKMWDLACSPMDDNERRFIRLGHYMGWIHRMQ